MPATGRPASSTRRSPGRTPADGRRAARRHRGDAHGPGPAGLAGHPRRQGAGAAAEAEPGPPHRAVGHQLGEDAPGVGVHGDGQAEALADAGTDDGGVDADHPPGAVGQRPTRVARMEGGVGLDHLLDDPLVAAVAGDERAAEAADDAGADRPLVAERAPDGDHELADRAGGRRRRGGRPRGRRGRPAARRGPTAGSAPTTRTPTSRPSGKTAVETSAPRTTWAEVTRNPSSVRLTADPALGPVAAAVGPAALAPQRRHARRHPLGHVHHGVRVGVEDGGVLVVGRRRRRRRGRRGSRTAWALMPCRPHRPRPWGRTSRRRRAPRCRARR